MTNARRPIAATRSHALPSLLALAAVTSLGAVAAGCISEAHAQQVPAPDAGVRPQPPQPPRPPPPPHPVAVPGGIGRVGPAHPMKIH